MCSIGMTYNVTNDGRNAASHERSAHAGSGEKSLASAGVPKAVGPDVGQPPLHIVVRARSVGDITQADMAEEELGVTQPR